MWYVYITMCLNILNITIKNENNDNSYGKKCLYEQTNYLYRQYTCNIAYMRHRGIHVILTHMNQTNGPYPPYVVS